MTPIILIPCKDLDRGKSRLAACLTPRSRRALCEFFLCRTLDVATATVSPANVRVVTSDPRVGAIAREYGVAVLADRAGDLNGALEGGRQYILTDAVDRAGLVLPIDLPLATPAALGEIAAAPQDVVIVPDEAMDGTNVLRLGPRALRTFRFAFGPRSYSAHCANARAAGLAVRTVSAPSLAFDVDDPEQYRRWAPENPAWGVT
jgi:2-phospho-L-lactate guanylyltransferase